MLSWWRPNTTQAKIDKLQRRMDKLEASEQSNQQRIDADTAALQSLGPKLDQIRTEIDALKGQSGAEALDFSNLDSAVAQVTGQVDTDVAEGAPGNP